jgi:hypothetical protein
VRLQCRWRNCKWKKCYSACWRIMLACWQLCEPGISHSASLARRASIRHTTRYDVTSSHNVQWGWCVNLLSIPEGGQFVVFWELLSLCWEWNTSRMTHETHVVWTEICIAAQYLPGIPVTFRHCRNWLFHVYMLISGSTDTLRRCPWWFQLREFDLCALYVYTT